MTYLSLAKSPNSSTSPLFELPTSHNALWLIQSHFWVLFDSHWNCFEKQVELQNWWKKSKQAHNSESWGWGTGGPSRGTICCLYLVVPRAKGPRSLPHTTPLSMLILIARYNSISYAKYISTHLIGINHCGISLKSKQGETKLFSKRKPYLITFYYSPKTWRTICATHCLLSLDEMENYWLPRSWS